MAGWLDKEVRGRVYLIDVSGRRMARSSEEEEEEEGWNRL